MSKIFGQKPMYSMTRLFRFVFVYLLLIAVLPLSPTDEHQIVISGGGGEGTLKWSFTTGSAVVSSPAVGSDGTIYVGSFDKKLYAIYGSGSLANTPWPMFHHDLRHSGRVGGP